MKKESSSLWNPEFSSTINGSNIVHSPPHDLLNRNQNPTVRTKNPTRPPPSRLPPVHPIQPLLLHLPHLPTSNVSPAPALKVSAMAKRGALFRGEEVETASPVDLRFEAPLKVVEYPNPVLRKKNKRIGTFDENLKRLVDQMFDVMYKTDGIGLSAPQIGVNVRLMVFNPAGIRGEGEEVVLVNPKIFKFSKKTILFEEGCLSFPKIYGDVERPSTAKVEAQDLTGCVFTISLSGLPARVFQHEFDHLQGTLFFERMYDDILDSVRSELQVLEKKYEDQTGFPNPEKIENYRRRKVAMGFTKH